jgi:hypothetical protein
MTKLRGIIVPALRSLYLVAVHANYRAPVNARSNDHECHNENYKPDGGGGVLSVPSSARALHPEHSQTVLYPGIPRWAWKCS